MFTGIIETTARIISSHRKADVTSLVIEKPLDWDLQIGQSIAVNGACLTVTSFDESVFTIDMMGETLKKTSFGTAIPSVVNLERAMLPTDRFEGHIVQGHVDTTGVVAKIERSLETATITIVYDTHHDHLVVNKGSITIHGVSLTVVDPAPGQCSVCLIPHTLEQTTLGDLKKDDTVNLEFDIIGKYISKK